jgi:hypothetical protein
LPDSCGGNLSVSRKFWSGQTVEQSEAQARIVECRAIVLLLKYGYRTYAVRFVVAIFDFTIEDRHWSETPVVALCM